jgi:hypothetical protein
MAGFLTSSQIWGATVFVDHFSDYVFVALMRDLGLDETLLAKSAFECHAHEGGILIESCRADNGRFCGTSACATSTNLSIKGGRLFTVAGIGHSQSMRAQPYSIQLSKRLLSRSRSVGSERVNLRGSVR